MFVDVNTQCVFINMPVGEGHKAVNMKSDVEIVQMLLNKHLGQLKPNRAPLSVTGTPDGQTKQAIRDFQKQVVGFNKPDGRVDPAGKTLKYLNEPASPLPKPPGPPPTPVSPEGTLAAFIESLELRHIPVSQVTEGFNRVKYYGSKIYDDLPSGKGRNSEPPMVLWHNIAPTLIVLDEIAEQLGRDVNPTNTYRAPAYNNAKRKDGKIKEVEEKRGAGNKSFGMDQASSGVARNSQHMAFRAIDFTAGNKLGEALTIAKSLRGETFDLPRPIRMANPVIEKVGECGGKAPKLNLGALKITDTSFVFHGGLKKYGSSFIHIDCRGHDWNG